MGINEVVIKKLATYIVDFTGDCPAGVFEYQVKGGCAKVCDERDDVVLCWIEWGYANEKKRKKK